MVEKYYLSDLQFAYKAAATGACDQTVRPSGPPGLNGTYVSRASDVISEALDPLTVV
jgi:hypothetical protein